MVGCRACWCWASDSGSGQVEGGLGGLGGGGWRRAVRSLAVRALAAGSVKLVLAPAFKAGGARREAWLGGFDSHCPPPHPQRIPVAAAFSGSGL